MAQRRPSVKSLGQDERCGEMDPCEIERVAYELYEQRGREDGHDLEDWLKAEALVRQEKR